MTDSILMAELLEEICQRLEAGESVDLTLYTAKHPELASQLQQLVPAMNLLGELSQSSADPASAFQETATPSYPSLGDYRLVRQIGRGGMGVVYEAEQMSLARRVAVKILPFASLWTESALERFRNEVRIAAMLEHPNIVPIYGMGCERGVYFYAMKLVDGCSLSDVIGQRKLGSAGDIVAAVTTAVLGEEDWYRAVARLGKEAATALAFAHQQGVIHRDIKPSNLLLDRLGKLFVADFGLARFENDVSLTRTGDLLGTPRYMSPEQASGSSKQLDPRTDIYSLGATLYEMLTLRPVISGPSRAAAIRQLKDLQFAAPRTHDADIPQPLEQIALKCLHSDPSDRYTTAAALVEDLGRFLAGQPVLARAPSVVRRTTRWIQRHPQTTLGLLTVLVLCSLISTASFWMTHQGWLGSSPQRGPPGGELVVNNNSTTIPPNFESPEESPDMLRASKNNRIGKTNNASNNRTLGVEKLEGRALLAAVPTGLVSWWTGDNTAADVTGRNNGVLTNGSSFTSLADGKVAQGFDFDGIDDIVLATTHGLPVGQADRTIELWARVDQFNADGSGSLLASYGTPGNTGNDLKAYGQVYSLTVGSAGVFVSTWGRSVQGPIINTNQWYHIAATNTGRTFRLYVDGKQVAFGDLDVQTPENTVFKIGRQQGGNSNRIDGKVDEVSVYDRALSETEINDIYLAGSNGKVKQSYITADFPRIVESNNDSIASFTIRRTGSTDHEVVVDWETADITATSGLDYVAASGQIIFGIGASEKVVNVAIKGDTLKERDETFRLVVSTTDTSYAVLNGYATIVTDEPITKFFVVNDGADALTDQTYEYQPSGSFVTNKGMQVSNTAPRGAASSAAGDKVWVVDANKKVYVYDTNGSPLGNWTAGSLSSTAEVEGITTNGTDVWIVDARQDRVYRYANAANVLTGNVNAVKSFSLNSGNKNPKDIVTDGTHLWVVNDSTIDKVFKYTLNGSLVASWTIATSGLSPNSFATSPTGIALDPSNPSSLWIVDNGTSRVYEYFNAIHQPNGTRKWADASFALALGNTNPQGIADPPPRNSNVTFVSRADVGSNMFPLDANASRFTQSPTVSLGILSTKSFTPMQSNVEVIESVDETMSQTIGVLPIAPIAVAKAPSMPLASRPRIAMERSIDLAFADDDFSDSLRAIAKDLLESTRR